jgi:hypothetical protein
VEFCAGSRLYEFGVLVLCEFTEYLLAFRFITGAIVVEVRVVCSLLSDLRHIRYIMPTEVTRLMQRIRQCRTRNVVIFLQRRTWALLPSSHI